MARFHEHTCDCGAKVRCEAGPADTDGLGGCTARFLDNGDTARVFCDQCLDDRNNRVWKNQCVECGGRLCEDCGGCKPSEHRECDTCSCEPIVVDFSVGGR